MVIKVYILEIYTKRSAYTTIQIYNTYLLQLSFLRLKRFNDLTFTTKQCRIFKNITLCVNKQ